ncbi:TetR/AcrR family transcriptional regulator [Tamaricihabitans halophyticus]|uniref:TetR/AcrR family transcriptional regulator n=1 Tax=Tamaricihabitans halophyticus TaxID=1262583 RepID=UPI0010540145|nr:TetR/AcrR family transcriptional regulator [Tamaricihabitans halophyticus]
MEEAQSSQDGRQRRGVAVDRRIYDAALAILREHGAAAVTIESVAARSGVARTTIYRRHKDRDELLGAALNDMVIGRVLTPGASLREDLIAIMHGMASTVDEGLGVGVIAGVVLDDDPDRAELIRAKYVRPRREMVCERLRQAIRDGELRKGLDVEAVAELLLGGTVARFVVHGDFNDGWAERLLDTLWPALTSTTSSPRRGPATG